MPADAPTILATSGGATPGRRVRWELGPLSEYAVDLAGVTGRAPKVSVVATAVGDNPFVPTDEPLRPRSRRAASDLPCR